MLIEPDSKRTIAVDTYHVDHLGPIPSTNRNYAHILSIIDSFTKFIWHFPVKTRTAAETLEKVKDLSNVFGNPNRIISDRGTAFTANLFQDYCKDEGIESILCTTGVPRGNGQIERINRIIISSLTKLSTDNPEKWYLHVRDIQKFLNNTHQRAINTTPFQLMFGVKMKTKDSEISKIIEEEMQNDFDQERDEMRLQAKQEINKIQEENRRTFNSKRKIARKYEVGDLVAIGKTQFVTGAKLKPKNCGPYEITQIKKNDRYEIKKLGHHEGPNKTNTAADNMKPWPKI